MAWRFKASKYKNSTPIVPKFENLIRDLSIGSYHSHGNYIESSAAFMAFNWDVQGSNLAVLPLDTKGRQSKANIPMIYAHSDFITDFKFSPFDDGLLATGSNDTTIKIWRIPASGLTSSGLSEPELVLASQPRRIETVDFHPTADNILATSSANFLVIWDLIQAQEIFSLADHGDEVQCVGWQPTGKLVASQCKDKKLRVIDPRSGKVVAESDSHEGIKDSKVVWIGDSQRLLTTGFSSDRSREIFIRDLRNLSVPQKSLTLDQSSGILIPLYDHDTNMCFLAGKGDRNVQFVEITNSDPFIVEGLKYSGDQTKGACLVPKRAMDVMQGEVNRVLQLCDSSVVPITWQVPRKSYREYHSDIYPETNGLESAIGPSDWWSGSDLFVPKINLDPKKRPKTDLVVFQDKPISERPGVKKPAKSTDGSHKMTHHSNGVNGSTNGKAPIVKESDNRAFVKPTPRPRVASRDFPSNGEIQTNNSNLNMTAKPFQEPSPSPSPRIISKSNSEEQTDEGLDFLRRQSSIRDRKKMFEEVIRQNQEPAKPALPTRPLSSASTNIKDTTDNAAKQEKEVIKPKEKAIVMPKEKEIVVQKENQNDSESRDQIEELNFGLLRKKNAFLANDISATENAASSPVTQPKRPASKVFGRISKFKHLKGDVILKGRFENLKNLSKTMPAECNFVQANADRIALPLTGPGGKIAVFETSKPGRIPDGVTPVLINGTGVMDFTFDPFDHQRIVCACDDGLVRVWQIPSGGLVDPVNEPEFIVSAHLEKVQLLKFHPLAKDILLTAAFDRSVKIWNLNDPSSHNMSLLGHTDQLFSADWSKCGRFVATVCRDGKIRIFEPKNGEANPIIEGGEIVPKKGARVTWILDNKYLLITGFSKQSERQVSLYRSKDLHEMTTLCMDVSPTILRPFFDEDSSTLFLTGKGDSVVTTFEVSEDAPHFFPLSPYRPPGLHQGLAFLPKNVCDVRAVEFARAFRILDNSIEPVSFSVPRIKTAFFQDDLFPPTRVFWQPTMTAEEWIAGARKQAPLISLQPSDMQSLAESTGNSGNRGSASSTTSTTSTTTNQELAPVIHTNLSGSVRSTAVRQKASDLQDSVSKILHLDDKLEQDQMEGVEEKEWDDDDD